MKAPERFKRTLFFGLAIVLGMTATHCLTLFDKNSIYQELTITGAPEGATVEVIGSGKLLASGPASKPIRVRKAKGLVLRVTKPGYKTAILTPDPKREEFPLWAILPLWPYGLAILMDYESGARVHFDAAQLKVNMPPLE